jgi:hypothetical protein
MALATGARDRSTVFTAFTLRKTAFGG